MDEDDEERTPLPTFPYDPFQVVGFILLAYLAVAGLCWTIGRVTSPIVEYRTERFYVHENGFVSRFPPPPPWPKPIHRDGETTK